jgi:transposase
MSRKRLKLNLSSLEREEIESIIVRKGTDPRVARRCRIILMTEEGIPLQEIADRLGLSKTTANTWRQIFKAKRMRGLRVRQRAGRPPKLSHIVGSRSERLIRDFLKQVTRGDTHELNYRALD